MIEKCGRDLLKDSCCANLNSCVFSGLYTETSNVEGASKDDSPDNLSSSAAFSPTSTCSMDPDNTPQCSELGEEAVSSGADGNSSQVDLIVIGISVIEADDTFNQNEMRAENVCNSNLFSGDMSAAEFTRNAYKKARVFLSEVKTSTSAHAGEKNFLPHKYPATINATSDNSVKASVLTVKAFTSMGMLPSHLEEALHQLDIGSQVIMPINKPLTAQSFIKNNFNLFDKVGGKATSGKRADQDDLLVMIIMMMFS